MKIVFLIERSAVSGGNYVVYQHALYAGNAGHDITIATLTPGSPYHDIWHPAIPMLRFVHIDEAAEQTYDIAFATFWLTALELHRIPSKRYAYFVQSIESRFYPAEAVARRACIDAIYAWKLPGITEATWIRDYLERHHGSQYHLVRNGIRKDLYKVEGPPLAARNETRIRILIEGSFGAIKNTARALSTARRAGNNEVWLLTTKDIPWYPNVGRLIHRVPADHVPPIYRSCDVILKLSLVEGMFGPPLEMFHCGGTAIVYDVSGHDEYIINGENALVAPMHDEAAVIDSIRRLSNEPQLLAKLKRGALETASMWPSWDRSSWEFLLAIDDLCSGTGFTREQLVYERERLEQSFPEEVISMRSALQNGVEVEDWRAPIHAMRKSVQHYKRYLNRIVDGYRNHPR